jgi:hypothetical protein
MDGSWGEEGVKTQLTDSIESMSSITNRPTLFALRWLAWQDRVPGGRHREHHRQRHSAGAGRRPHPGAWRGVSRRVVSSRVVSGQSGECRRPTVFFGGAPPRHPQETADAHNLELGTMLDDAGMVGTTTPAGACMCTHACLGAAPGVGMCGRGGCEL